MGPHHSSPRMMRSPQRTPSGHWPRRDSQTEAGEQRPQGRGCQEPPFLRWSWRRPLWPRLGPRDGRGDTVVSETGKGCQRCILDLRSHGEGQSHSQGSLGPRRGAWLGPGDVCPTPTWREYSNPENARGRYCAEMFNSPPSIRTDLASGPS